MLARVYRRVADGRRPCVVSARGPLGPALAAAIPAPVVLDELGDVGPLGALVTVAARVGTPLIFAVAGDLPEIDADFVDDLEAEYDAAGAAGRAPEAIVPRWPSGAIEPLASLYETKAVARAGSEALAQGRRRVSAMVDLLRVRHFAVRPQDERRLVNVNTPPDYEAYRRT